MLCLQRAQDGELSMATGSPLPNAWRLPRLSPSADRCGGEALRLRLLPTWFQGWNAWRGESGLGQASLVSASLAASLISIAPDSGACSELREEANGLR